MAVIKVEALKFLAERIACAIPQLEGKICVLQAFPNHNLGFPSLAIVPAGKWRFYPDQDGDDVFAPQPGVAVFNIGRHEISLQLQLATASQDERGLYEQLIEQCFYQEEFHPGVLYGAVKGCEEDVGPFTASYLFEGTSWEDDKAFQNQSWSYIEVTGSIPALVSRRGIYRIQELQLGLTEVFGTTITAETFNTDSDVERVDIGEDGSITPQ